MLIDNSNEHQEQSQLVTATLLTIVFSTESPRGIDDQMLNPPSWSTCHLIITAMFFFLLCSKLATISCMLHKSYYQNVLFMYDNNLQRYKGSQYKNTVMIMKLVRTV